MINSMAILSFLALPFILLKQMILPVCTGTILNNDLPRKINLSNPEEYVNILGGTDSRYDLSHGSTLPLITLPWGFNNYAPQTDDDSNFKGWWFHPSDRRYFGLRVTHQPSPWIRDYGNFLIKAYMPKSTLVSANDDDDDDKYTSWAPQSTVFRPYYFRTTMLSYSTSTETTVLEFTPTSHGGIIQVKFPAYESSAATGFIQTRRIAIVLHGGKDQSFVSNYSVDGAAMLSGYTTVNSGGVGDDSNGAFAHFFVATIYGGEWGDVPLILKKDQRSKSDDLSVWIDFDAISDLHELITIRFATSFISIDQALINMRSEVSVKKSFSALLHEAKNLWKKTLSRVMITAIDGVTDKSDSSDALSSSSSSATTTTTTKYTESQSIDLLTTFYSSLYRASLFPRSLSEYSEDNQEIHWSPYTTSSSSSSSSSSSNSNNSSTRIGSGPLSVDSGFWDAWNTVYPLLSLSNRPMLGRLMQGWVNAYKEGGWLPKWASPGYRGSMVGTMGDVSVADAIVNEIPGFDIQAAYEAIRKDAFEVPSPDSINMGRECMESYLTHGYIPHGVISSCSEVVSRTLNYLQSDYAISQTASKLGHDAEADVLMKRSQNYSLLFDVDTGFFRSRTAVDGKFTVPFDEFSWGDDYTEAGPWQYRFYVPHDPTGLAELYRSSGRSMCDVLEAVHTSPISTFHTGGYGTVIHEMTELAVNCWGQFSHNNQPDHHMLYMYMHEGYASSCASKGQARIRQTLSVLYKPTADMFAGDEDNGEMGAWYVLSALGLYNLSPGSGVYIFGSPLFGRVEVDISDIGHYSDMSNDKDRYKKKVLVIEAVNNSPDNKYIQSVRWNDETISGDQSGIGYAVLREGGVLTFVMGPHPIE